MPKNNAGNHQLDIPGITRRADAAYEKMMDEVFLFHHQYPSDLKHIPVTPGTQAEMNEADSYARSGKRGSTHGGSGPKAVRWQYDPDFCNGIPRRK